MQVNDENFSILSQRESWCKNEIPNTTNDQSVSATKKSLITKLSLNTIIPFCYFFCLRLILLLLLLFVAQTFRFDGCCAWYRYKHVVCGFQRAEQCRSPSGLKPCVTGCIVYFVFFNKYANGYDKKQEQGGVYAQSAHEVAGVKIIPAIPPGKK